MATIQPVSDPDGLLTGEELFHAPDKGCGELVRGKWIPMPPTGYTHGITEMNIADGLRRFVRKHGLGTVMVGG